MSRISNAIIAATLMVAASVAPAVEKPSVVARHPRRDESVGVGCESEPVRALEDLRRILASREALYARADAVVDTASRTVRQSLKDLERAVPASGPKETKR